MPLRMAITKVSGQGEQLVIDVAQWNPVTGIIMHTSMDEMKELFNQGLQFADDRLQDMNLRMLEAYKMEQFFDVATWQKVVSILDILAGRQNAAQVTQRWLDTAEEQAELEQMRAEAYAQMCDSCGEQHGYHSRHCDRVPIREVRQ